jgi:hypothetical protein
MDVFALNSFPLHNISFCSQLEKTTHLKKFLCEDIFSNYYMYKFEVI